MKRRIVYPGLKFTIAYIIDPSGACPAGEFFDSLGLPDKAKMNALFRTAADHAPFHNPEKFGNLGAGLYEFKSHQIRMPFAYSSSERQLILVTHGFIKKKDKTPREEIDRALYLLEQNQRSKISLVKKTRK